MKNSFGILSLLGILAASAPAQAQIYLEYDQLSAEVQRRLTSKFPAPDDVAKVPPYAIKQPNELAYQVLQVGDTKRKPTLDDSVMVHFTGWTPQGRLFDASRAYGRDPRLIAVRDMIPGWREMLLAMREGEKRRVWIPAVMAYQGVPNMPQTMMVFDIELIGVAGDPMLGRM